eukprot:NODE_197_length_13258_cov_0.852344.p7 type:complete len:203 gc:universal NODE_197_length_13258_cov_0.852344:8888-8280(-)
MANIVIHESKKTLDPFVALSLLAGKHVALDINNLNHIMNRICKTTLCKKTCSMNNKKYFKLKARNRFKMTEDAALEIDYVTLDNLFPFILVKNVKKYTSEKNKMINLIYFEKKIHIENYKELYNLVYNCEPNETLIFKYFDIEQDKNIKLKKEFTDQHESQLLDDINVYKRLFETENTDNISTIKKFVADQIFEKQQLKREE